MTEKHPIYPFQITPYHLLISILKTSTMILPGFMLQAPFNNTWILFIVLFIWSIELFSSPYWFSSSQYMISEPPLLLLILPLIFLIWLFTLSNVFVALLLLCYYIQQLLLTEHRYYYIHSLWFLIFQVLFGGIIFNFLLQSQNKLVFARHDLIPYLFSLSLYASMIISLQAVIDTTAKKHVRFLWRLIFLIISLILAIIAYLNQHFNKSIYLIIMLIISSLLISPQQHTKKRYIFLVFLNTCMIMIVYYLFYQA